MSDSGKSWEMMEGETFKSYEAFEVYYKLPKKTRTIKLTASEMGRVDGYRKVLEAWSSKFSWPQRAKDYDSYMSKLEADRRQEAEDAQIEANIAGIKAARQVFIERAEDLALTLIEHTVDPDATSPNVRATIEALNRAGVTVPQEIQLRVAGISRRPQEGKHKELTDEELSKRLREKMGSSE